MKIDFANLQKQYQLYKNEIDINIKSVLDKSNYILGEEVNKLEEQLRDFCDAKHAITCASGTDALLLAMMAMDIQPDDEVITTPFTFIATAETIAYLKAKPVFVDIDEETYNIDVSKIEAAITSKTRIIMPVSLFGQPADMGEINDIARKHGLKVIIDGAQSFGATINNRHENHYCDIYTTSFFPAKPLGCYGDGGAVFTSNVDYAEKMAMMRVHGQNKRYHHKYIGIGGRFDTLQAAVLLAKLPHYSKEIELRQKIANKYNAALGEKIQTPKIKTDRSSVWAQYTIRVASRDETQKILSEKGVPTAVHYPMPLHMQECFAYLKYEDAAFPVSKNVSKQVMSLPMNPFLTDSEIEYITDNLLQLL